MKRYFFIGLALILALSLGAIFYGAWLNSRGEFQIARRMEERRLSLRGARVEMRELQAHIDKSAVKLYSTDMADAVTLVDGRIVSCLVQKNSFVKKGDPLFVLENEDIPLRIQEAESNILSAQSSLRRAENTYRRYLILKEQDAVSAQQYDDAEAGYYAAQSNLAVMETRLSQLRVQESRQTVAAPIDGKVLVLYRQQGAYVQSGTALALVGDFSSLYFSTPVQDTNARHLALGQEAELVFSSTEFNKVYSTDYAAGNLGQKQKFFASIVNIAPPISEPAAIRSVLWKIDNRAGLLEPQTYGGVSIQSMTPHAVLAVPLSAITDHQNASVFVARDGVIERRAVRTGANDGVYIEILSGLEKGELVVSAGAEGLEDGMRADVEIDERLQSPQRRWEGDRQ